MQKTAFKRWRVSNYDAILPLFGWLTVDMSLSIEIAKCILTEFGSVLRAFSTMDSDLNGKQLHVAFSLWYIVPLMWMIKANMYAFMLFCSLNLSLQVNNFVKAFYVSAGKILLTNAPSIYDMISLRLLIILNCSLALLIVWVLGFF